MINIASKIKLLEKDPSAIIISEKVALDYKLKGITRKINEEISFKVDFKKIGRNDLCPCGSGKKFKKCCLV